MYGRELYHAFERHPQRTNNFSMANFFITTVGNECNYPNFDMRGCTTQTPLAEFAQKHEFYGKRPHVVFLHTTPKDLPGGLINVAYTRPGIVIPPPAITRVEFGTTTRKPRVYFQGTIDRTIARKKIIHLLQRSFKNRAFNNFVVKQKGRKEEYIHFLQTSEYALVVSGDLPWSYRVSEVIQSGAIPLFIKEDNHPLPMSDEIDWNKCAEFVSIENLSQWSPNQTAAAIQRQYLIKIRSRFVKVREVADYVVRAIHDHVR